MRRWIAIVGVGLLGCTEGAHGPGLCTEDESVPASDECNTCTCSEESWGVTEGSCSIALPAGDDVACYGLGIGDIDDITPGVQVECSVQSLREVPSGLEHFTTPMCVRGPAGWTWPAADVDACWFARTDATRTGDPIDDVSAGCVQQRGDRLAVEIEVMRRSATEALDLSFQLTCTPPDPLCPGWATDDS